MEKRNDEKMLRDITRKALIAREFKTYEKCYRDYTRILYEEQPEKGQIYDVGDYENVCSTIEEQVNQSNVCISIKLIVENYRIGQGHSSYELRDAPKIMQIFNNYLLTSDLRYETSEDK